jgi:hypothetical protein
MSEMTSTITAEEKSRTGKAYPAKAYAAQSAASGLAPAAIQRRAPRPQDLQIEILLRGLPFRSSPGA